MKIKITRADGVVIEVEGTPDEVARFVPAEPFRFVPVQPQPIFVPLNPLPWTPMPIWPPVTYPQITWTLTQDCNTNELPATSGYLQVLEGQYGQLASQN